MAIIGSYTEELSKLQQKVLGYYQAGTLQGQAERFSRELESLEVQAGSEAHSKAFRGLVKGIACMLVDASEPTSLRPSMALPFYGRAFAEGL